MMDVPVFVVTKNGSLLENIVLSRKQSAVDTNETFIVGRHPYCHLTVSNPTISLYHLCIQTNPSVHEICVFDLSSGYGTRVCGNKIEPEVHVVMREGDTLKLGLSDRVYQLHWMPAEFLSAPVPPTIKYENDDDGDDDDDEEEEAVAAGGGLFNMIVSLGNKLSDCFCCHGEQLPRKPQTPPSRVEPKTGIIKSFCCGQPLLMLLYIDCWDFNRTYHAHLHVVRQLDD